MDYLRLSTGIVFDPSIFQHALTCWVEGRLAWATLIRGLSRGDERTRITYLTDLTIDVLAREGWTDVDWIVIEGQVIRSKNSAESIKKLARAAGSLETALRGHNPNARVYRPIPENWKGSMSKLSCEQLCRMHLSPVELLAFDDQRYLKHWRERKRISRDFLEDSLDVWDSVGLGMAYLNRGLKMRQGGLRAVYGG